MKLWAITITTKRERVMSKCAVCNEPIDRNAAGVSVEEWCVWHTRHDQESEGK